MNESGDTRYELYYWNGIQGRGEFVRLAFEEAGVPYVDVARLPPKKGGGDIAIQRLLEGEGPGLLPFAPPLLKVGELVLAQVANILFFVGPRLGLAPESEAARAEVNQLQLTIADFIAEVHDTHHPIAVGKRYETQKVAARRRAAFFVEHRLPRFLSYFEDVLARNTRARGRFLVGNSLTYADLSMFQTLTGLEYAFPTAFGLLAPSLPRLSALRARVEARPKIAAYLGSEQRLPNNESDIFRRYPELDAAPARRDS
jgi:glutathione S-transferase